MGSPDLVEKFANLFTLSQRSYIAKHIGNENRRGAAKNLRTLIAHSHDGLDEISAAAPTDIWMVEDGEVTIQQKRIEPGKDFGLTAHPIEDFCGGSVTDRVAVFRSILRGDKEDKKRYGCLELGAVRDFILINASSALFIVGKCADFKEGVAMARRALDDGSVLRVVDRYCTLTNE